ncbi:hypothetical protein LSUE1_G002221 [Lachnellula suecica]|uniref:Uncharacterized protein n=1 Tax=Lachnellula suecica TaxID=602035 RepID=A0A8T9C8U6_9HELO|nr:hypothetical protein LSUE1_G002221 [Lachnellula suecica]
MDTKKPSPSGVTFDARTSELGVVYSPPPGVCDSECVDCGSQYRSIQSQGARQLVYGDVYSEAEAREICALYAKDIREDLEFLRSKISSHGNTIINRWKKKSRDKRSTDLQKAYPQIFPQQWTAPRIQYEHGNATWRERPEFHQALLLPFLNLEVLTDDPFKLLSLLHYRTKFEPQDWVSFDLRQTTSSWESGGVRVDFADCCVVLHGANYGKVVSWNTEQAHRWDIAGFPRGKLILEAQQILLQFLRKTVEQLLNGIDREGSADKWAELEASHFRRSVGSESWSAFSNEAFSAPIFDVSRLVESSQVRLAEAEDHLWLLQTDPEYFQDAIKNGSQGRIFKINDPQPWNRSIAINIWAEPLERVFMWRSIAEEVEHLKVQYMAFRDQVHIGERLPPKLERAFGSLELLLINILNRSTKHLLSLLPRMVAFHDLYCIDYSQPGDIIASLRDKDHGNDQAIVLHRPIILVFIATWFGSREPNGI